MIPLKDQDFIREKFSQELLGQVKIDLFTERGAHCRGAVRHLQPMRCCGDGLSD
jgi:hypothetical protein